MKREVPVEFFFDHYESGVNNDLPAGVVVSDGTYFYLLFDVNTTHEEIVRRLAKKYQRWPPLDSPQLRYNLVLQAFEMYHGWITQRYPHLRRQLPQPPRSLSKPVTLREGQTLASTHLIELVMDESEINDAAFHSRPFRMIWCAVSIEVKALSLPEEKPSSASPSLGETIINALTSQEAAAIANFITIATGLIAFTGVLRLVAKQWSKKHDTKNASSHKSPSQPSETDIVAIRLRMTHGNDPEFEEWLTEPDRLKHYIDVFNQPSGSIQPLYAIFVQRNGKAIKVDVSKGAQDNPQLNELLSYLNIDSTEK